MNHPDRVFLDRRKLCEADIRRIQKMREQGVSYRTIQEAANCSSKTIAKYTAQSNDDSDGKTEESTP